MKLGETARTGLGKRDAFHAPAILVKKDPTFITTIGHGMPVRFTDEARTQVKACTFAECHAIVDPFVDYIGNNDYFWVLLRPGVVQNLVHHFEVQIEETEIDDYDGCSGCYGASSEESTDDGCSGCYTSE